MEWASVITATKHHVFGTASRITPSEEHLLTLNFPLVTDDYLVVLDRFTGAFATVESLEPTVP